MYLVGAIYGVHHGSGIQKMGESSVAYAFFREEELLVWSGALIFGTILLGLGVILSRLGRTEESDGEKPQN